jgi:hypothetical protein
MYAPSIFSENPWFTATVWREGEEVREAEAALAMGRSCVLTCRSPSVKSHLFSSSPEQPSKGESESRAVIATLYKGQGGLRTGRKGEERGTEAASATVRLTSTVVAPPRTSSNA